MNGYLMQERSFVRGGDTFLESYPPEQPDGHHYGVVFEDDTVTGYFYAVERDAEGHGVRVLDALHIYEAPETHETSGTPEAAATPSQESSNLKIVWSRDWKKCALIIDGFCHAIFDFEAQGGYNINEFPPPNSFWTQGDRKLTDELIQKIF